VRRRAHAPDEAGKRRAPTPAQMRGRRAFGWLQGERYEWAVLATLAATALVALAASVV
jgi:hypothetical protein